jgi:hypothetical protein
MKSLRELVRYPTAIVGLIIIVALVGLSVYAIVSMP